LAICHPGTIKAAVGLESLQDKAVASLFYVFLWLH